MSNVIKFPDPKKKKADPAKFFDDLFDYVISQCDVAKHEGHVCVKAEVVHTSKNEYTLTACFVKPEPDDLPDIIA